MHDQGEPGGRAHLRGNRALVPRPRPAHPQVRRRGGGPRPRHLQVRRGGATWEYRPLPCTGRGHCCRTVNTLLLPAHALIWEQRDIVDPPSRDRDHTLSLPPPLILPPTLSPHRTEITRFPHAVLEVKLSLKEGQVSPPWVQEMVDSGECRGEGAHDLHTRQPAWPSNLRISPPSSFPLGFAAEAHPPL